MKPNDVKELLHRLYHSKTRFSVLLLGGQGTGKTTAVREFAEETAKRLGREFVDYEDTEADKILANPDKFFVFHDLPLVGVEPVDLTGQPRLVNGQVAYFPLRWAYVMSKCPGVLFLDDFLDTQRMDVMSAAYRIFLQKRVGYIYLHPDVQVVAASNTPEFSTLSQMMPAPLANRAIIVSVSTPNPREWAEWMNRVYGDEWDKRVFAFLSRFEGEGYIFRPPKEAETLEQHPTPRSWTMLAKLLWSGVVREETEEIAGVIGEEMATKFSAFLKVNVDIEELAKNPEMFRRLPVDARYMVTVMLATALGKKGAMDKFYRLIEVMRQESREWLVLLFIALRKSLREEFLLQLGKKDPELPELFAQVVRDKGQIEKMR